MVFNGVPGAKGGTSGLVVLGGGNCGAREVAGGGQKNLNNDVGGYSRQLTGKEAAELRRTANEKRARPARKKVHEIRKRHGASRLAGVPRSSVGNTEEKILA